MAPRASPTHFLCLQLASLQLTRNLAAFRADVTGASGFGIPGEAVRPPGTLHLTLGVMSLNPEDISPTLELLKTLRPRDILTGLRASISSHAPASATASQARNTEGGLSISLRGIHSMTNATRTPVLYAAPSDAEGILYSFCQELRKPFKETGAIEEENRPLLLHATVVNTVYVRGRGGGRRKEKLLLDASNLMSKYKDYLWAEDMPVRRVAVCRMGAKKVDGDEVYEVEGEIEI